MLDSCSVSEPRATFISHLECSWTGRRYPADRAHGLSREGKPLLVRYDLEGLASRVDKSSLSARPSGLWRYREFLPVRYAANVVSLGEVATPLVPLPRLADAFQTEALLVKDEGRLPTGSFKARGLAVAVSMARELGLDHLAMASNGNAGAALAAYCGRAGLQSTVFCPEDTPPLHLAEIGAHGGTAYRVNGLIDDCARLVAMGSEPGGWFDVSTLKEPYRIEGKKTMGLELADQFGWDVPDVIFYPTGGGTGLIGMWKAFAELGAIGWIGAKRPRLVAVQAEGCAPLVRAYDSGESQAARWEDARTVATGIRVPAALGDYLILEAVRKSGGFALAVSDEAILAARDEVARAEGMLLSSEGAATYAAYKRALHDGRVARDEVAVLFNCASGLKSPLPDSSIRLDRLGPIDFALL